MQFEKIIKKIRKDNNLTQEELADKLNVSRQAISNWENNKNLPDIEMIIIISKTFSISLDDLILGGKNMSEIQEKLIQDGADTKRTKMYTISNITGLIFCILGLITIFLKGMTVEYIDSTGTLHENFFLLPIGFGFIFIGLTIVLIGLSYYFLKTKDKYFVLEKVGYMTSILFLILTLLIYSNSDRISIISLILSLIGVIFITVSKIRKKQS